MLIEEDFFDDTYNGQDWKRWRHKYDGKLTNLDDAHKAVETMLASLGDRYTRFLDKEAFTEEKSQIKAELCGIGVQIGINKEKKKVLRSDEALLVIHHYFDSCKPQPVMPV